MITASSKFSIEISLRLLFSELICKFVVAQLIFCFDGRINFDSLFSIATNFLSPSPLYRFTVPKIFKSKSSYSERFLATRSCHISLKGSWQLSCEILVQRNENIYRPLIILIFAFNYICSNSFKNLVNKITMFDRI